MRIEEKINLWLYENHVYVTNKNSLDFFNDKDVIIPNYPEIILVSGSVKKDYSMVYFKDGKYNWWDGSIRGIIKHFKTIEELAQFLNSNNLLYFRGYNKV